MQPIVLLEETRRFWVEKLGDNIITIITTRSTASLQHDISTLTRTRTCPPMLGVVLLGVRLSLFTRNRLFHTATGYYL